MQKVTKINVLQQFQVEGVTYGTYMVVLEGARRVFVRCGDKIGVIAHFKDKPVSQCIIPVTGEAVKSFFKLLEEDGK